ncbi:MAG TPA: peptidoglycan-binding protein, partial [archaeon]|nr:peptidoglycan-binding protein [archaeon]
MTFTKSSAAKLAAGVVGFAMTVSVFMPVLASADTASDLQAQINSLLATISSLQAQLSATTGGSSTGYTFNTNLTVGSTGADVMNLQKVLNMSADTKVASSGAGSPGSESSYFGGLTKAAVVKFQVKNGITPAVGYVGPITRAKLNAMAGTAPVVPPVVTPGLPTGGSLSVSAGSQPANSLAPQSASRVPFTTVVLSAGSSDVTVNSITVERVGLAQDAVFSGVVLLNSDGMQIGISKTLNSNHQAMVGEPWVIKAGTSQTVTVAGNMASSLSAYSGQVVGLNVVAVNTSASVSGSLPISGAQHTVNSTLSLGTATLALSSFDPNQAQTKEIGVTGYNFAGVRVTAGSVEQVKLWSVRWNQSGSASSNDLSNVKVYVDGTAYDTVVSSDGKYYSAV